MDITDLTPGGFASACYLVTEGTDAILIDCSAPVATVKQALTEKGATLHAVLCTHGHFDHILTADSVREAFDIPLYIHESDGEMLACGEKNAYALFFGEERAWRPAEHTFGEGDCLRFGQLAFTVLHTPGHSLGSSVLQSGNVLFTGDTLFDRGIGRTDLYGGDTATIKRSLERLFRLPPDTVIYPGHGCSESLQTARAYALDLLY